MMAMAAAEQATGIGMDVSKNRSKNLSYCSFLPSCSDLVNALLQISRKACQ